MAVRIYLLSLALVLGGAAHAAEPEPSTPAPTENSAPGQSGKLVELLKDALRGLTGLLPRPDVQPEDEKALATLGIRGAESTATLIRPYWKGDLSHDPHFREALADLNRAIALVETNRFPEADAALNGFAAAHPGSPLLPTAEYAQALAIAGSGDTGEAADRLRRFRERYPQHPLAPEAEKLADSLR